MDIFIDIIKIAISVGVPIFVLICTIIHSKNQEIRQRLSENRPILFASIFGNVNIECNERKRKEYNRLIARTDLYDKYTEDSDNKFAFLRIRNSTDFNVYNVSVDIEINNYKIHYTIDTISKRTEYMILLPPELYDKTDDCYISNSEVIIVFYSITGEKIEYRYSNQGNPFNKNDIKASHNYNGSFKFKSKFRNTFNLDIENADAIRTIEINKYTEDE